MLKKYRINIKSKKTNKTKLYIINTMYNIHELCEQLHNMYDDNYIIDVEYCTIIYDVMINEIMKLNNICVARNVQCYNL